MSVCNREIAERFEKAVADELRTERRMIERLWQKREAERVRDQHRAVEPPEALV